MEPALPHRAHDERPWGGFEQFTYNDVSTVKILTVRAGQQFSLQRHTHRDEFWCILSGTGSIIVGDAMLDASSGDEFWIPRGSNHRARASDNGNLSILEISLGEFNENDIERLADDYGRA